MCDETVQFFLAQATNLAKTQSHSMGGVDIRAHLAVAWMKVLNRRRAIFELVVPVGVINIRCPHLDAMFAGIAHDFRGGIKAHWLRV